MPRCHGWSRVDLREIKSIGGKQRVSVDDDINFVRIKLVFLHAGREGITDLVNLFKLLYRTSHGTFGGSRSSSFRGKNAHDVGGV
jgi:hypothetical protein